MNTFYSLSDENGKFKAAQELSEHLEFIVQNPYYNQFLKHLLNEFLAFIEVYNHISDFT